MPDSSTRRDAVLRSVVDAQTRGHFHRLKGVSQQGATAFGCEAHASAAEAT